MRRVGLVLFRVFFIGLTALHSFTLFADTVLDETVPLRITYLSGAVQRQYEPDFIVIDDAGVHWIVEGKRDVDMASPVVIAKREAAAAWVKTVNGSDEVHETWAYLLASESVCSAATSWEALKSGSQVFR